MHSTEGSASKARWIASEGARTVVEAECYPDAIQRALSGQERS
jgi:hypothetical protein